MLKITLIVSFIAGFVNLPSQAQNTLRQQYVLKLYDGKPVPKLWVPLLSHFQEDGLSIDTNRTKRHLQEIAQNVGGVLIPGSTGEGWEMELPARLSLLEQVLPLIKDNELAISIGILRTSSERVFSDLDSITARLMVWSQKKQLKQALDYYNIKGFTICNPKGTNISQDLLIAFWEKVLTLGYPMIFYQLPQVTGNELNVNSLVYLSKNTLTFI